jgi:two-component system, NarL family, sensor kinase
VDRLRDYRKPLFLLLTIAVAVSNGYGQSSWEHRRDSLLTSLSREKQDSDKTKTLLDIGVLYLDNHPDSADYYAKTLCKLSEASHLPGSLANGLSMQGYILSCQNKHEEAIAMDMQAIAVAKKANLPKVLANIYNNTAICYSDMGEKSSSLDYYLKAEALYEQTGDSSSMTFIYGNIAGVYNDLKEFKSGYWYSLRGIALCRRLHSTHGLGSGMVNLACALINLKRYDTALVVLVENKILARKENNKYQQVNVLGNIDYAYAGLGKFNLIKANADEMMTLSRSIDNKEGICYALVGLAEYWAHQKKPALAIHYADSAIAIARAARLVSELRDAYQEAANVEVVTGNLARYHYYDELRDSVDDAILSDKILKNTQELDAKYSLNKKQAEIDALNKERVIQQLILKQRNTMNWALSCLVLVTALIGLLYNRNYRQKKKLLQADTLLQQQRILELEKEKQLLAARGVLQGQVDERTRLAKDLHDGLGSILSSAKYSFSSMKDNLIITSATAEAFDRSMGMLDRSITELRSIAHNMMPEALVRFGLDTALKDFCHSVDQSGAIRLTYQSFDIAEGSISALTAGAVYRIIQELVNNILKHAGATTALVQLVRKGDTLSITVEDNGKGFNTSILQTSDGTGYLNLKNRVDYLNGTIDIQTAPDKGTSVYIEISNLAV